MSAATDVYKDQAHRLWYARDMAVRYKPPGQKELSQDEEALRAECLMVLWEHMTSAEHAEMEAWIEANRPETKPLDSDSLPCAPSPPKELHVVPVFMAEGEWVWVQGAPSGYRYILADDDGLDKLVRAVNEPRDDNER